ncbi:hypothetical protein [Jiella mangrovi]|uniref:Uncharacterized protein n=1 Tax=Jiella mangrovi TaxID=2821407 RepID=A0ABS4BFW8_9HYPH|nr:hypothetical protein [Jiella mangrovi]MBP0615659.1 hypothetical protein [Jiella mangrovi]
MLDADPCDPALLPPDGEPEHDAAAGGSKTDETSPGAFHTLMAMACEVPVVLSLRIPLLIGETAIFSPVDREETRLSLSEKSGAFFEGVAAAQAATLAAFLALQAETISGRLFPWHMFEAADMIFAAGLAPSLTRLQANGDRLSAQG